MEWEIEKKKRRMLRLFRRGKNIEMRSTELVQCR